MQKALREALLSIYSTDLPGMLAAVTPTPLADFTNYVNDLIEDCTESTFALYPSDRNKGASDLQCFMIAEAILPGVVDDFLLYSDEIETLTNQIQAGSGAATTKALKQLGWNVARTNITLFYPGQAGGNEGLPTIEIEFELLKELTRCDYRT